MAKKRKAATDAEINGPRKRGRKKKQKVDEVDDDDEVGGTASTSAAGANGDAETSEAAATRISASLRSTARDPAKRPSYKLYDSDDESLSGSSDDDELGSDDYQDEGEKRGRRRASDSDELADLTDSDEEADAGARAGAAAAESAVQDPTSAAAEGDKLEVDGELEAEMPDARRSAAKGKAASSSAGKGKARVVSPARTSDTAPAASAQQEQASASSDALPSVGSVAEVVEGEAGTGAAAASAEEAAAQGAAVAAARDEKEGAKQAREDAAAAGPEPTPASAALKTGGSAAEGPSRALDPRSTRTWRGAPSPFAKGKDAAAAAAAAAAPPTTGRPSRAAAAKATAALSTSPNGGSSRSDRAARRELREGEPQAGGAEQDESLEGGALSRSQNGRASASATSSKPTAAAKKGKGRSRASQQQEPSQEEDQEVGPSQSHDMLRGGAGFGAGVPANGSSHDEDSAAAQTMPLHPAAANGDTTAAHVYSLPRPPHLSTASVALADASAMMDGTASASTSASVEARSPSAASHASHASSQFIYPDASNPYGSSPYPAYPHQVQTPGAVHHHPTRPLPGPYLSEPGLARTAFYYHGASPIPRPFIHPGHGLTEDLLDSADAAGVYGDDFAQQGALVQGGETAAVDGMPLELQGDLALARDAYVAEAASSQRTASAIGGNGRAGEDAVMQDGTVEGRF